MVRVRRRANRRLSGLGLVLSMGLILGAGGAIWLTETNAAPGPAEHSEEIRSDGDDLIRKTFESPDTPEALREPNHLC